jgi:hypothetical protein
VCFCVGADPEAAPAGMFRDAAGREGRQVADRAGERAGRRPLFRSPADRSGERAGRRPLFRSPADRSGELGEPDNGEMSGVWSRAAALRVEDVAMALANLVAVPLLANVGVDADGAVLVGRAPLLGLLELVAVLGAIAAVATRSPDRPPIAASSLHGWLFAGPLLGAVGIIGADASAHLGVDAGGVLGLLTLTAVVAAFVLGDRLPVIPEPRRRLLVAPLVLMAGTWFTGFVGQLLDGLDLRELGAALFEAGGSPELLGLAGIVAFFLLAGSAAFYAMLVVAPRELAAPEPEPAVWLVRYLVFVVTAAVGAGGVVAL